MSASKANQSPGITILLSGPTKKMPFNGFTPHQHPKSQLFQEAGTRRVLSVESRQVGYRALRMRRAASPVHVWSKVAWAWVLQNREWVGEKEIQVCWEVPHLHQNGLAKSKWAQSPYIRGVHSA